MAIPVGNLQTRQAAAAKAAKRKHRPVKIQCFRCLKTGVLQPQLSGSAGGRAAQLLIRKSNCSQDTGRDVVRTAGKQGVSNGEQTDSGWPEHNQEGSEQNGRSAAQGPPEEETSAGVKIALSVLRFYKREISPILPPSCRFIPTCSEYAMDSFKKYGVRKGCILTAWRLLRCNPFGPSGYDPVTWPPPKLEWIFDKDA